tara:strand:- start:49 stop:702 length:654 start_codon:yes stop_codon:yes gene_type:complete
MRINSVQEIEELIEGHHDQMRQSISLIDFISKNKKDPLGKSLEKIFNYTESNIKYFSFLTSSFIDLLTTLKGFINSVTEWEFIYNSKSGYLTIYETIKTYHKYQLEIKDFVSNDHPHLFEKYKELNIHLRNYKKKFNYKTEISTIRNKTAGHFDENFIDYYEQIEKLDKEKAIIAIEEFLDFLKLLMIFTDTMAQETQDKTSKKLAETKREYYRKDK